MCLDMGSLTDDRHKPTVVAVTEAVVQDQVGTNAEDQALCGLLREGRVYNHCACC